MQGYTVRFKTVVGDWPYSETGALDVAFEDDYISPPNIIICTHVTSNPARILSSVGNITRTGYRIFVYQSITSPMLSLQITAMIVGILK